MKFFALTFFLLRELQIIISLEFCDISLLESALASALSIWDVKLILIFEEATAFSS